MYIVLCTQNYMSFVFVYTKKIKALLYFTRIQSKDVVFNTGGRYYIVNK